MLLIQPNTVIIIINIIIIVIIIIIFFFDQGLLILRKIRILCFRWLVGGDPQDMAFHNLLNARNNKYDRQMANKNITMREMAIRHEMQMHFQAQEQNMNFMRFFGRW